MEHANSDYIEKLSGNNIEFKKKIIEILKRELLEEVRCYYNRIQDKDYLMAASCVHKLKNKISILGLEKSYYIAEKFEDNLKENSTDLEHDFNIIIKIMEEFVKKI